MLKNSKVVLFLSPLKLVRPETFGPYYVYGGDYTCNLGRDSSVGIATRYGLDGPGIESLWAARFSAPVQTGPGAYPASYTMGTGSFPG